MSERANLGKFLREVIDWSWDDFVRAEQDNKYSPLQGTVLSLVRISSEKKLGAIKLAIRRVDGNLDTPVQIIYPKIFNTYPYATEIAGALPAGEIPVDEPTPEEFEEPEEQEPVSFGLRETLNRMGDTPDRRVVPLVLAKKEEVEEILRENINYEFPETFMVPAVKSVISANLLDMAMTDNNFEAITEVFDQIDGKLVETIRFLGDDVFIPQYAKIAPEGAILNKNGVYMLENKELTGAWEKKFASKAKF